MSEFPSAGSITDSNELDPGGLVPDLGFIPQGAVCPEPRTIARFEYPLARPLFLYVNRDALKRPEVAAFLLHYVSDAGQELISDARYIPLSPEEIQQTRATLNAAIKLAGTTVSPEESGTFRIDGSSTVFEISQAMAESFMQSQSGVNITVNYTGTGTGIKMISGGEIEIAGASRGIKSSELATAKSKGIELLELKVAIDGVSVVVHPENTWVEGLNFAQLKQIWEPGSRINKWSDLEPSWPEEVISLCGPGSESGTFDFFTEVVVGEAKKSRADYQASPNDNTAVKIVSDNRYSLGYLGYGYVQENLDKLKPLCIAR